MTVQVQVTTLVVDHPNAGVTVTVHPDQNAAMADLWGLWESFESSFPSEPSDDGAMVQQLCDRGYVIYFEDHVVDAEPISTSSN